MEILDAISFNIGFRHWIGVSLLLSYFLKIWIGAQISQWLSQYFCWNELMIHVDSSNTLQVWK